MSTDALPWVAGAWEGQQGDVLPDLKDPRVGSYTQGMM